MMRSRPSVHARLSALTAGPTVSTSRPSRGELRAPRWLRLRLAPAALPWPADTVWTVGVGAVVLIASFVTVVAGPLVGLMTLGLAAVVAFAGLQALAGREAALVDGALPDALEATARGLRSGASLHLALGEAAAAVPPIVGRGLEQIAVDAAAGEPLVDCIDRWAGATPGHGVRLTAAALALAAELGGGTARALDHVAATLRDRAGVRREIRALSSQARASALVIGAAPVGFAALAAATDPTVLDFLTHRAAGLACLASGLALDAGGAWWMHRIATVEV